MILGLLPISEKLMLDKFNLELKKQYYAECTALT